MNHTLQLNVLILFYFSFYKSIQYYCLIFVQFVGKVYN